MKKMVIVGLNPNGFTCIKILGFLGVFLLAGFNSAIAAIIADHNSIRSFDNIPSQYIQQAKTLFRIAYGHTSHGSQIPTGMQMLRDNIDSNLYAFNATFLNESLSGAGAYDLGNQNTTNYYGRTRNFLASNPSTNVIMWSWCGQVSSLSGATIQTDYLNNMAQLERDYPNVTFIYMTGHLDGTGEAGRLHQNNNLIRAHVQSAPNAVLFDFADIESYDPDGNYFLNKRANDNCDYYEGAVRHNWATEWCANHPGECPSCTSCAHSQCLNCFMKGKAFWWMIARLAGWDGVTQDPPTIFTINSSAGPGGTISPAGNVPVNSGSNRSFSISPNTGYHIVDVLVDGNSQGAIGAYTFNNVAQNHSVSASFAVNTYQLTSTATHGQVERVPDQISYNHGDNVILTPVADYGYRFLRWSGCVLTSETENQPLSIVMLENKSITAHFEPIASGAGEGDIARNIIHPSIGSEAEIRFELDCPGHVVINIFSRNGLVRELINKDFEERSPVVKWDGRNEHGEPVASGIYTAIIDLGGKIIKRKIAVVK